MVEHFDAPPGCPNIFVSGAVPLLVLDRYYEASVINVD
jgi:hypothetical protein